MPTRRNDPETTREACVNVPVPSCSVTVIRARAGAAAGRAQHVRAELRRGHPGVQVGGIGRRSEKSAGRPPQGISGRTWARRSLPQQLSPCRNTSLRPRRAMVGHVQSRGSRAEADQNRVDIAQQLHALPQLEGGDRVRRRGCVGYVGGAAGKYARTSRRIADIIASTDQAGPLPCASAVWCCSTRSPSRTASPPEDVDGPRSAGTGDSRAGPSARHLREHRLRPGLRAGHVLETGRTMSRCRSSIPWWGLAPPPGRPRPIRAAFPHAVDTPRRRVLHAVPAGHVLSRLVFHDWPAGVDWRDHEFPASLNVADLACGTGTLLMAVATEVGRLHTAAGGRRQADLHKWGTGTPRYDVQLSAVHSPHQPRDAQPGDPVRTA